MYNNIFNNYLIKLIQYKTKNINLKDYKYLKKNNYFYYIYVQIKLL